MFPRVLVIAGLDPTGRAGLARDIATLNEERIQGSAIATVLTVQGSGEVTRLQPVGPDIVKESIAAVLGEGEVDAVKIGLVPDGPTCQAIATSLQSITSPIVLDPVMRSGEGKELTTGSAREGLMGLMRIADVVTPNIPEACLLTGTSGRSPASRSEMAKTLIKLGPRAALIKGGHASDDPGVDILVNNDGSEIHFPFQRLALSPPLLGRGKGCELSTRMAALMAKGLPLEDAVRIARTRLAWRLEREGHMHERGIEGSLREYVMTLERLLGDMEKDCVPEVATNVAYAPKNAKHPRDVIGLAGRITIAGESIAVSGWPTPGGPHHTGRIALSAARLTGEDSWVMNHRWSEKWLEGLGHDLLNLSRKDEPKDTRSTMEWMVELAVRERGFLPPFISDTGSIGKEAMIRILARTPDELVSLHRRLHKGTGSSSLPQGR